MRALVAGWFSFEHMGATAGDLLSRDAVVSWLEAAQVQCDVAVASPFTGGVDWMRVDPAAYSHLVFVCGPFGRSWEVTSFLERFSGSKLIGVNLSMLEPLENWNPFDLLLERDSSRTARPDLSFLAETRRVPTVGVVLIDSQPEYREQNLLESANARLTRFVQEREVAVVNIDTRLDVNAHGLRTAAAIESLIARMDVVLTTRMHGLVLSLRNGVPVVAVDPVAGGAKVIRQAATLGWPCALRLDQATPAAIEGAFEYCLCAEAREQANQCASRARQQLALAARDFAAVFRGGH